MTIAQQVARIQAHVDANARASEFISYARFLMMERGSVFAALKTAEASRALPRVLEVLKAATTSASTTDATWASPLAPYGAIVDGFLAGLAQASAFDALLPDMRQFPLHTQIAATTVVASATVVPEASAKAATKLTTVNGQLAEKKAVCVFAVSMELLRAGGPGVSRLLETELRNGVAAATDVEFVDILTSGLTPIPSSGTNALGVRADLRALLAAVNTDKASRLWLLMQPSSAEQLAAMGNSLGGPAFPQMTVTGGMIGGIQCVTTDACGTGEIVLCDAAQIAAGQQTITLDASQEASLQLNDSPDSPTSASTPLTSLWQMDLAALRATRYFGALRLRSSAVATLSGASYLGNSPA